MEKLAFVFGDVKWELGDRPRVMGILNVTPDSFSDGSKYCDAGTAVHHAEEMVNAGADIIDVGGESTRPGAEPVDEKAEWQRVGPVISALAERLHVPVSIDTRKATVAQKALQAGAEIVNDVSGLHHDPALASVAAEHQAGLVLMHMRGTPKTMQKEIDYEEIIGDICSYFHDSLAYACQQGVAEEQVVFDPGIGFGKTVEHNLELIRAVHRFRSLGRPILMGPSRKSFIGKLTGIDEPEERLWGTAAAVAACVMNGADILRVHDVAEMNQVCQVAAAIREKDGQEFYGK